MAFAAVISLKQTINALLGVSSSREILEFAYDEATSLQRVLERLNDSIRSSSERVIHALEGKIRDCAYQLEDVLELHESIDGELEEVRKEITSFSQQVKRLEVEFIQELSIQDDDNDDDATDEYFPSKNNIDSDVELVGNSGELFIMIRYQMTRRMRPDDLCVFSLLDEEVGHGRTIVAKRIFDDLRNGKNQEDCLFDCSAWVKVGAEYELKEVMIRILAQIDNLAVSEYDQWLDDEKLVCKQLYKALNHQRYMIVLDDVRDVQLIEHLLYSCPDQSNGSLVLFTTNSEEAAQFCDISYDMRTPRCIFEGNMWICLRLFFFRKESISAELEEAGRKIVENCEGRPLSFAKVCLFRFLWASLLLNW